MWFLNIPNIAPVLRSCIILDTRWTFGPVAWTTNQIVASNTVVVEMFPTFRTTYAFELHHTFEFVTLRTPLNTDLQSIFAEALI